MCFCCINSICIIWVEPEALPMLEINTYVSVNVWLSCVCAHQCMQINVFLQMLACLHQQSESQLYIPTPMTHICDVFVPLPWFQARYRREHAQHRSAPSLPLVENLLKDNTDGCALTALLHFYCPQAVKLEGGNIPSFCNHTHLISVTTPSFIVIIQKVNTRLKSVLL